MARQRHLRSRLSGMRYTLAVLIASSALYAPVALAQEASDIAACRNIADSLLRLRCFDNTGKTSVSKVLPCTPISPVSSTKVANFKDYSALPYYGQVSYPNFRGRDREYATFRTRILAGTKPGPNFAGYLAMIEIGCGSSCRFVYVVDVRSGQVSSFPIGGEDYYSLDLKYRVDSRLVSARWVANERCKREDIIWDGTSFQRGSITDLGLSDICYRMAD